MFNLLRRMVAPVFRRNTPLFSNEEKSQEPQHTNTKPAQPDQAKEIVIVPTTQVAKAVFLERTYVDAQFCSCGEKRQIITTSSALVPSNPRAWIVCNCQKCGQKKEFEFRFFESGEDNMANLLQKMQKQNMIPVKKRFW